MKNGKSLNLETLSYGQITVYQLADQLRLKNIMEMLENHGCEVVSAPESDYEDSDSDEYDSDNLD